MGVSLGILKSKGAIEISKEKGTIISITDIGKDILKKGFPEEAFLKKTFPISTSEIKDLDRLSFENLKKRHNLLKINIINKIRISI